MVFQQDPHKVPLGKEHAVPRGDKVPMSAGAPKAPADDYQAVMMEKLVGDVLSKNSLLVVSPADSLETVVALLRKEKQSSVLVVDTGVLQGIVSKRDLLRKTAGREMDLANIKVDEVMTANPEVVHGSDPLAFAVRKMTMGGFRHLPVLTAENQPIGIISIQDVLSCLAKIS